MAFPFGAALAAFVAASADPGSSAPQLGAPDPVIEAEQAAPLIEPASLKAMMAAKTHLILVDVRQPEEFAAGHLEGATLIPMDDLAAAFARLPRDAEIVVYCRSGRRSAAAVGFLRAQGYDNAVSLDGGYVAWTAQQ